MASVADLVVEPELRRLATAQAYDGGVALAGREAVTLGELGPTEVTAEVLDEGTTHVALRSAGDELSWSCDCPAGTIGVFCRHCVATAVTAWRAAPGRRG